MEENEYIQLGNICKNLIKDRDKFITANELLSFANNNKNLKIVEEKIPQGILPVGYNGKLMDIKIKCRGPDDEVYKRHVDIYRKIPRSLCLLELQNTMEVSLEVIIFGFRKMLTEAFDEDDFDMSPSSHDDDKEAKNHFYLQSANRIKTIYCMEKINGEAAVFAGRFIEDTFYYIVGSKNVRMLIRNKEDIERYKSQRHEVSINVSYSLLNALENLHQDRYYYFKKFLHDTEVTVVCEILQPNCQHIIDLSYLQKCQLYFISFTWPHIFSQTAFPPQTIHSFFNSLGFITPKSECIAFTTKRDFEIQNLGKEFMIWIRNEIEQRRLLETHIRPMYPSLWKQFLKEKNFSDRINFEKLE